jgi:hypothetical protein
MAGRSARPGLVDLLLSIDDPVGIRSRLGKHSGATAQRCDKSSRASGSSATRRLARFYRWRERDGQAPSLSSAYISMPGGAACECDSSFGASVMEASVVKNNPATEAAFCRARRVTLVGSRMPISIMSPYSPDAAL